MIGISGISIHFGGTYLFDNISFVVRPRDRIGLVGRNGAGKSTLLKIIAGINEASAGVVTRAGEVTIGYLPQEGAAASDRSVYDEAATAFAETLDLEKAIENLSDEIARRTDYESEEYMALLTKLAETNERFAMTGGGSITGDIERILTGLGFTQDDLKRPMTEFSGGWQMRVELAKILLRKPSCILLDEPTNHLDIESIQWLELFLKNYDGAIVMVSHDRKFLDTVTNRTIEISLGKVYDYNASYSTYVTMRAERREQQLATYKNQQKLIEQTERFIERFRYKATKATQVQSRVKQLEKLDRVEIDLEDTSAVAFRFPPAPRSGKIVAEMEHLHKAYDDSVVLNDVNFNIGRGDRIAFVGKNGEGKSTLARILVGQESYDGALTSGHNVAIGYYAQHQAELLNADISVLDVIDRAATGEMRTKIRDLLGAFLFSGDSVYKKVKVLSGGEKSRLALAKLLLEPINFLILDEPTNHLDMASKDILKNALRNYDGTLIVVSHDRDFLQGLANRIIEFRDGALHEFMGDIYEFLRDRNVDSFREFEATPKKEQRPQRNENRPAPAKRDSRHNSREEERRVRKEIRRMEKLVEQCERDIETLEQSSERLEAAMAEPEFYASEDAQRTIDEYNAIQSELPQKMEYWEQCAQQLDELRNAVSP